jgi:hypothetical protein
LSVGNDVVDLDAPDTRLEGLHPRWDERVFGAAERRALEASSSRHLLHWALWAAKESAYKARKRLDPETVFAPREFEIELSALPARGGEGTAVGRAVHRGRALGIEVHVDGSCLHAVARSEGESGGRILWKAEAAEGDPGITARQLAATAISSALGLDLSDLRIVGRPPVATLRDRRIEVGVSLSHHGRFVAFACRLGDPAQGRRERPEGDRPRLSVARMITASAGRRRSGRTAPP